MCVCLFVHSTLRNNGLFVPLQGHEINQILSLKPSAFTRVLTNLVLVWQFENPTSTKDECKEWLLAEKEAGRIEMPAVSTGEKKKKGKHQDMAEPKGEKKTKMGN